MSTRRALGVAMLAAAALLATAACSGGGSQAADSGKKSDGSLTVAAGGPTYPKNFNWYGANTNGTAPGLNLLYESPFELDYTKPGQLIPKLAMSYDMEDGGETMVFHLRKGVKWSDGVEMTAEDFAYTYGFVNGDACADEEKCWASKPPEVVDKYTVKLFFHGAQYQQMASYAQYYPIYPAHIWKNRDRKTDTNEKPVGTGPFTLKSYSNQQVVYTLRDDYWGARSKGVNQVKFVPMGPIGGVQAQLNRGEIDLAEGAAAGVEKDFVSLNPELNHFTVYPSGGSQIITFNTLVAPFDDVAVRKAMRSALDLQVAADLSGVGFTVPSVVGLDTQVYKDTLLPDYAKAQAPDVEGAKKLLADAGWTITDGNLSKDGKTYPLELKVDNGNPTWMQLGQVYTDQWQKNLGLKVAWAPAPTQVFNKSASKGEYALFGSGGVSSGNYYQGYAQFSEYNWKPVGEEPSGNYGRWKSKEMDEAVSAMSDFRPDDTGKLKPLLEQIQKSVAEDAPFIPVMTNTAPIMWSSRKWTGYPEPGRAASIPSVAGLNNTITTILNLTPSTT